GRQRRAGRGTTGRPRQPGVLPGRRRGGAQVVPRREDVSAQEELVDVTDALLDVDEVTLRFGGVRALGDVSFQVLPGELFAVIGPNGAGKTSIFNCLNGVYRPQAGHIRFKG